MPVVERIALYPIKSLDPVFASSAKILPGGALEHDREFALFDDQGKIVNGKRNPGIHRIRAEYELQNLRVTLHSDKAPLPQTFHLVDQRREIESWLADSLQTRVSLERNTQTGFPDDLESPGPTIVSTASLREVGSWFGFTIPQDVARRFRANIELSGETPFWEDRLFGDGDAPVEFRIGSVHLLGVNPCQRCAVPTRDPFTGEVLSGFQSVFSGMRERTLPAWAPRIRFNHFYRLTVNTRIRQAEAGKRISCGDLLSLA
jgi:uncharacterized protein YcbX